MGRRPKSNDYVNNEELKQLLVYWIENNPNEDGEFLDKYEKTIVKKKKMDDVTRQWIAKRRALYATERKWTPEFAAKEEKLFKAVYRIVEGRVNCFKYDLGEREDLVQEIMYTEVRYLNRYNELMNTSAFAYVTQLANNAIKLYLGNDNDSRWCRVAWNELNDQCVSALYGTDFNEGDLDE